MEREGFFSGYCRCTDASRTVLAEAEDTTLLDVDCSYADCPHRPNCPVAEKIRAFVEEA